MSASFKPAIVLRASDSEGGKVLFLKGRNFRREDDAVLRASKQLSRLKHRWPSYASAYPTDKAEEMVSAGLAEVDHS
jgi:hypothetical protein